MDLVRFQVLVKHWGDYPPVHMSVAAYLYGADGAARTRAGKPGAVEPIAAAQSAGTILDSLAGNEDLGPPLVRERPPAADPQSTGSILNSLADQDS